MIGYKSDVIPIEKDKECVVRITKRLSLVTPAYPEPCSYVRLVMDGEVEVGIWAYEEWRDDPQVVMGAIIGTMNNAQEAIE